MRKLWDTVRSALSGTEQDYTAMGVRRAIVLLSIPMVLEMGMEALFFLVDAYFLTKLGPGAMAIAGFSETMLMVVYSLAWGLGMGITAVVARRIGEKQKEGARVAAGQGVLLAVTCAFVLSLPAILLAPRLLDALGASDTVITDGTLYTRIMLASNVVIMLLFTINAAFRGAGQAGMALRSLALANLVNIALDPLLIFGLGSFEGFGVLGAAIATTTGRTIGVIYQLYHLFRADGPFALRMPDLRPVRAVIRSILNVAWAVVFQFLVPSFSWMLLVAIVAESGTDTAAGYFVAVRIIIFTLLPAWGMANAAATLVGQNLGAQQPDRAVKSVWLCGHYNMLFMVLIMILFWTASPFIVSFFEQSAAADEAAITALRVISLGYFFYGYGMVMAQAFNGAGDSRTPLVLNIICFLAIEVSLAYVLAHTFEFGALGVFISIAMSESILAVLSAIIFQRGKWKTVKV